MASARVALWRERILRFNLGAATSVISAVMGVARNKWLATHLDTAGLGVLAQVMSGQIWLGNATSLGLNAPIGQAVGAATARGDEAAIRRVLTASLGMVAVSVLGAVVLGLALAPLLSTLVLGSAAYAGLVRVSMIGVAGLAAQLLLWGLFAGRSDVRAPLTLVASGTIVATLLTFVLVPGLGLFGGAFSAAILFPVGVAGALLIHRRSYARFLPRPGRAGFDAGMARSLLGVGAVTFALALAEQGTLLALRSHYVRTHGVSANGLLQAALAMTQQAGAIFYTYLSNYAFGRISGAGGAEGVRAYTRRHWAPLMLLAAVVLAIAMVAAAPLLRLLYSHRFDPARGMMAWALFGEFAKVGMQVWALGALPLGGTRLLFPIGISYPLAMAVAYRASTLAGAGAMSVAYAYAAAGVVGLAVTAVLMGRRGVTLAPRDWGVLLAGLAALAALASWVAR